MELSCKLRVQFAALHCIIRIVQILGILFVYYMYFIANGNGGSLVSWVAGRMVGLRLLLLYPWMPE